MICCIDAGEPVTEADLKGSVNQKYAPYLNNPDKFQVNMCEACPKNPLKCCLGGCPITCLCTAVHLRYTVLNHVNKDSEWRDYSCCQSMYGSVCCFKPGEMGEKNCPAFCMTCEACCCPGMAISASRFTMMEKYRLQTDPCDIRIIRINNCLQCLTCVAQVVDCIVHNEVTQQVETCLECISNLVFYSTLGCMTAQVYTEIDHRRKEDTSAPLLQGMDRE